MLLAGSKWLIYILHSANKHPVHLAYQAHHINTTLLSKQISQQ
jgi:hypothetical protein